MKNKSNFRKPVSIILFGLILTFIFFLISCGANNDGAKNNGATDGAVQTDNQTTEGSSEATTERIYPDLEAKDYGGYEFTFLTRTLNDPDWTEWNHRDISAAEQNGDVLNDAVYNRNKKIEEKYNISIKETVVEGNQFTSLIQRAVKAGDDNYDVVCPHIVEFAALAQGGNLLDLYKVPNLDLTKPWWDQGTVRDLSIIHKLFILEGDLLIIDNDAMEAMIFNKSLLKDAALDDPYAIVKNGEWTFDKLYDMSRGIAKDLNGDGKMYIKDDLFGLILQSDTDISFLVSGGGKVVSKDANDYPVIAFGDERSVSIMEKVSRFMLDEDNVVQLHRYAGKFPIYDEQVKMFSENRALFSWIRMRIVERLRGMETDFGILPLPKLNKEQPNYITHNNPHTGAGISIPASASDPDRTGRILEDLSAESKYTLQPAYYEVNLRGKYARDDESQDMLDIILSNTAHDIGYVYNFGNFAMSIIHYGRDKKTEYVSTFEKFRDKIQKDIDKTVSLYEKLGN